VIEERGIYAASLPKAIWMWMRTEAALRSFRFFILHSAFILSVTVLFLEMTVQLIGNSR
jgi:hypothetical protein